MTRTTQALSLVACLACLSCSDDSGDSAGTAGTGGSSTSTGGSSGTGGSSTSTGGSESSGGSSTGGSSTGGATGGSNRLAQVRFVNVFAPAGEKSTVDIYSRSGDFVNVIEGLAYGDVSPYVDVTVSLASSETALFVPDAGVAATTSTRKILPRLERNKKYTIAIYDTFVSSTPEPTDIADVLSYADVDEADPRLVPETGEASFFLLNAALRSARLQARWGVVDQGCLGAGDVFGVAAGSAEIGLFDADDADCTETPLVQSSAIDMEDASRWMIVPVGESLEELSILALPVE